MILICAFCIVFIQTSTAHVFSYVPRNTQGNIQGPAQNLNNLTPLANNRAAISRPLPYANYNANNLLNANIAKTQLTNAELENARIANAHISNAEIANAKFSNAQLQNAMNAELANGKFANGQIMNAELVNSNFAKAELARFQPSWASKNIANAVNANAEIANNANLANSLGNAGFWANNNLVNLNGNMATFSLGDGPHAFTVTSGSPNSPAFGIQLMADALEVGGTVSVNGQYPIFGTVAVNGNLPTDGAASVNYSCGRPVNA